MILHFCSFTFSFQIISSIPMYSITNQYPTLSASGIFKLLMTPNPHVCHELPMEEQPVLDLHYSVFYSLVIAFHWFDWFVLKMT